MPGSPNAVFLSYASEDTEAAERIALALRAAGIEVWFDKSELRGGDAWDRQIRQQIHDCRLFIPVISANTERRDEGYFRREWGLAEDRTRDMAHKRAFLVPVAIDGTPERGASVPDKFHDLQWTRLPGGSDASGFAQRVAALLASVGGGAGVAGAAGAAVSASTPAGGAQAGAHATSAYASRQRRWRWAALLAVLILVIGAAALALLRPWRATHAPPAAAQASLAGAEKSVAVLPFVDLSEKHDQEYFAEGMSQEILSLLAQVPELKVIARTSSSQFKGQAVDVRRIGELLGAGIIVEGSVRRSGERVRVDAQAISARDGTQIWSHTYDRTVGDVLQLQVDIASAIAATLHTSIGADAVSREAHTLNREAYEQFLRGNAEAAQVSPESLERAVGYYREALRLDPGFIRAAEALLSVYAAQLDFGIVEHNVREHAMKIRTLAEVTLKREPTSGLTHAILADVAETMDGDWATADREIKLAVRYAPNDVFVIGLTSKLSVILGQWNDALRDADRAIARDPLMPTMRQMREYALMGMGRLEDAEQETREILRLSPTYDQAHFELGLIMLAEGKGEEALKEMRLEGNDSARLSGLAMVQFALGHRAEAKSTYATWERQFGESASDKAQIYAMWGDRDRAFALLDQALVQAKTGIDLNLEWIKCYLTWQPLRSDPRYNAFLRKINLPE